MRRVTALSTAVVCAITVAACGANTDVADAAPTSFACDTHSCQAGSEYCLRTYTNTVQLTAECVPLPDGCTSCPCAQIDAPTQFPTTNNCGPGTAILCDQNNNQITVLCQRSGM